MELVLDPDTGGKMNADLHHWFSIHTSTSKDPLGAPRSLASRLVNLALTPSRTLCRRMYLL